MKTKTPPAGVPHAPSLPRLVPVVPPPEPPGGQRSWTGVLPDGRRLNVELAPRADGLLAGWIDGGEGPFRVALTAEYLTYFDALCAARALLERLRADLHVGEEAAFILRQGFDRAFRSLARIPSAETAATQMRDLLVWTARELVTVGLLAGGRPRDDASKRRAAELVRWLLDAARGSEGTARRILLGATYACAVLSAPVDLDRLDEVDGLALDLGRDRRGSDGRSNAACATPARA